jgi:hypothetical protein
MDKPSTSFTFFHKLPPEASLFIHEAHCPLSNKMSLTFKPYDPFRQKQRAERRRHAKPRERTEENSISARPDGERLSTSTPQRPADDRNCSPIEESDFISTDGLDGVGDPYANFPSVEECLSFCSSVTDVSSPYTPASACSPGYQIDAFIWRGKGKNSMHFRSIGEANKYSQTPPLTSKATNQMQAARRPT